MNAEKTGKFIKLLREEKKLTQQTLAEKIHIGRQAISKWELGRTMPDYSSLIKLSEIFKVSIDELLAGEKNTKENVALALYNENIEKTKKIKKITIFILFLYFMFLIYYFFTQYNSTKVYTVSASNKMIVIENGLFIKTPEKIYFNLGNVKTGKKVEKINLVCKKDNKENVIYSTDSSNILLKDYFGYEEYFVFDEIKSIINNLYIEVFVDSEKYTLKLSFDEDYQNNNIFFFKKKSVSDNKAKIDNLTNVNVIELIKNKFELKNDIYIKRQKHQNYIEIFNYYDDINLLTIENTKNNLILEEWSYNLKLKFLIYTNYEEKYSFNYTSSKKTECLYGDCKDYLVKINEFKEKIKQI